MLASRCGKVEPPSLDTAARRAPPVFLAVTRYLKPMVPLVAPHFFKANERLRPSFSFFGTIDAQSPADGQLALATTRTLPLVTLPLSTSSVQLLFHGVSPLEPA